VLLAVAQFHSACLMQPHAASPRCRFQSVGLCAEAVQAFTRAGLPKRAVDCCVLLNQWDQAVALAQQHDFPQVEQLMARWGSGGRRGQQCPRCCCQARCWMTAA
jgi:hypothetical protein